MSSIDPAELDFQLRTKVYSLAAGVCLILTAGSLLIGDGYMSVAAAIFALLLYGNGRLNTRRDRETPLWLVHGLVGLLIAATLSSVLIFHGKAEQWCYILPLVVYLVYSLRAATLVVAGYSLVLALAIIIAYRGPEKPQLFFIYLFSLVMTLAFVYLREIKEKQLQPLRRTDHLTLASTREYLLQDLHKEVQRCEREGTVLSVLALSLDEAILANSRPEDKDGLLYRLGRLLHENLRLFDSYYRYDHAEMIIVMPYLGFREAEEKAGKLRQIIRHRLSDDDRQVTALVGIASLNVEDTAESLLEAARRSLKQARGRSGGGSHSGLHLNHEMPNAG